MNILVIMQAIILLRRDFDDPFSLTALSSWIIILLADIWKKLRTLDSLTKNTMHLILAKCQHYFFFFFQPKIVSPRKISLE